MKANQELFNRHFEEYKEWVISHNKFPTLSDDAKFSDGILMQAWRANYKSKITEFENSMEPYIANQILEDKRLKQEAEIFNKSVKGAQGYPWEPKTLQEYLEGDNRYHFFEVDTYIRLIKYAKESTEEIPWLRFEKSIMSNNRISDSCIGNKEKFEKFKKVMMIALNDLNIIGDRYRDIIVKRHGLDGTEPMTLDEIAILYDRTRETIRCIEARGLRKLRHYKYRKLFQDIYPIHDANPDISRGHEHWFVLWFDNTKTVVKANMADLEEAIDTLRSINPNLREDYDIEEVRTYTKYGYQIHPNIRLAIDELTSSDANNKIFNYTTVTLRQEPRESVKDYVQRYHRDMIDELEKQEILLERRTKAKKLMEESEKIVNTYQASMSSSPSMFKLWSQTPIRDIEDRETTLFKNEFPSHLAKIITSLTIDDDHEWVNEFNKSVRKYFIPTGCCTFAANTLKKCLDAKLHDYTIEVMFSAPSDIDHYLHIKFISDISENVIKVEKGEGSNNAKK